MEFSEEDEDSLCQVAGLGSRLTVFEGGAGWRTQLRRHMAARSQNLKLALYSTLD